MQQQFKVLMVILSLFIFSTNMFANEPTELKDHFLQKIDQVVTIVEKKSLSKEQRNKEILELLTPSFDFTLMAKLSLGRTWKKLSKEDKKKFVQLYVERMKNSYSSKIDAYSNEKVEVKEIKQPKKNRIHLVTDLISNDQNLEIVYKFYKPKKAKPNKDKWLIYDVEVLGVSILKTDKAQFKEFLQSKSIDQLLNVLALNNN